MWSLPLRAASHRQRPRPHLPQIFITFTPDLHYYRRHYGPMRPPFSVEMAGPHYAILGACYWIDVSFRGVKIRRRIWREPPNWRKGSDPG
jgi:hypothetical protein